MTEQRKAPPSFGDAARQMMTPGAPRLTEAEQHEVEAEEDAPDPSPLASKAADPGDEDELPEWVKMPGGLAIPPYKQVGYMRFKPELTERPDLGERTCVTWGLSVADERLARQAARGESTRLYEEMAKRTIRVVDGHRADWAGRKTAAGSVVRFWEEIGPKARMFVINQYLQTHTPNAEETADFFLNCCVYRTAAVG
jgi:hypothetical protein